MNLRRLFSVLVAGRRSEPDPEVEEPLNGWAAGASASNHQTISFDGDLESGIAETPSEAQPGQANPVVAQEWCDQFLKAGEAATDIYEAEEPTRLPAIFMVVARSGRRLWTGPTTAVFPKEAVHSTTGMKILRVLGLLALLAGWVPLAGPGTWTLIFTATALSCAGAIIVSNVAVTKPTLFEVRVPVYGLAQAVFTIATLSWLSHGPSLLSRCDGHYGRCTAVSNPLLMINVFSAATSFVVAQEFILSLICALCNIGLSFYCFLKLLALSASSDGQGMRPGDLLFSIFVSTILFGLAAISGERGRDWYTKSSKHERVNESMHEIKNNISGMDTIIARNEGVIPQRDFAQLSHAQETITRLVADSLHSFKHDRKLRFARGPKAHNLQQVINKCLGPSREKAIQKGVSHSVDFDPDLSSVLGNALQLFGVRPGVVENHPNVVVDVGLLEPIINNLAANGINYASGSTPAFRLTAKLLGHDFSEFGSSKAIPLDRLTGRLGESHATGVLNNTRSLRRLGQRTTVILQLVFFNTGKGIDQKEALEKLFRTGGRTGEGEAQGDQSHGVGLKVVRDCAMALRGRILVQSQPGAYACVIVEIPIDIGAAVLDDMGLAVGSPTLPPSATVSPSRTRVPSAATPQLSGSNVFNNAAMLDEVDTSIPSSPAFEPHNLPGNAAPSPVTTYMYPPSPSMDVQLRVLMAEDNPIIQNLQASTLRRLGCDVRVVSTGEEAEGLVLNDAEGTFNLVILDNHYGEGLSTGIQVARRIREARPGDFLVLCTADEETDIASIGLFDRIVCKIAQGDDKKDHLRRKFAHTVQAAQQHRDDT